MKDIKSIIPTIDIDVLNKLKSTFFEMPDNYYSTTKCTRLISDTLKRISENKLKVYIHLLHFKKELKSVKKLKRKSQKIIVRWKIYFSYHKNLFIEWYQCEKK